MHKSAYSNTERFYEKYCEENIENKKILDVGSYNVNGSVKPIFKKGNYVGVDMCKGPNVDLVANCNEMPFEKNHFDIVVSISCFEHDDMFWSTFLEMLRVLKPGGYIYINAPSNGPYHAYPGDNWRFYADSWKALERWGKTNGYQVDLVESYVDTKKGVESGEVPDVWNDSIGIFKKRDAKKVSLISSFCDTQEKIDILKKNILTIKSLNIDVIVISPFYLEKEIVDMCDYFFVTKDNPILEWPQRAMVSWKIIGNDDEKYKISTCYPDYGFAGLNQIKQLANFASSLDYNQFFPMIYDLKIDENVISGFKSDKNNSIYSSKRGKTVWESALHFMIFDKKNLEGFTKKITKENYLDFRNSYVEQWLVKQKESLSFTTETPPVEDIIYYYENHNFFNHSDIDSLNFFIEKNYETKSSVKIFFYDNEKEISLIVKVDENEMEYKVKDLDIIDLGFYEQTPKKVSIIFEGQEQDLTQMIKKIKHNTITKI